MRVVEYCAATGDVSEIRVADVRQGVVAEHRIEVLGELRAAPLVDATGIVPDEPEPIAFCRKAAFPYLGRGEIARVGSCGCALDAELFGILKELLASAPDVGKDSVAPWDVLRGVELVQFGTICAE